MRYFLFIMYLFTLTKELIVRYVIRNPSVCSFRHYDNIDATSQRSQYCARKI